MGRGVCILHSVRVVSEKYTIVVNYESIVYYESIQRELQTKLTCECRYDERLKILSCRIYTPRMDCVGRQNKLETLKELDEVNKREVHECDVRTRDEARAKDNRSAQKSCVCS